VTADAFGRSMLSLPAANALPRPAPPFAARRAFPPRKIWLEIKPHPRLALPASHPLQRGITIIWFSTNRHSSKQKKPGFGSAAGVPTGCRAGTAPGLVWASATAVGEFGFYSPTFWAQKVGNNACPPEGESRRWRDRGRPWALHALFACGKRTSAPGAAFRCQAGRLSC